MKRLDNSRDTSLVQLSSSWRLWPIRTSPVALAAPHPGTLFSLPQTTATSDNSQNSKTTRTFISCGGIEQLAPNVPVLPVNFGNWYRLWMSINIQTFHWTSFQFFSGGDNCEIDLRCKTLCKRQWIVLSVWSGALALSALSLREDCCVRCPAEKQTAHCKSDICLEENKLFIILTWRLVAKDMVNAKQFLDFDRCHRRIMQKTERQNLLQQKNRLTGWRKSSQQNWFPPAAKILFPYRFSPWYFGSCRQIIASFFRWWVFFLQNIEASIIVCLKPALSTILKIKDQGENFWSNSCSNLLLVTMPKQGDKTEMLLFLLHRQKGDFHCSSFLCHFHKSTVSATHFKNSANSSRTACPASYALQLSFAGPHTEPFSG